MALKKKSKKDAAGSGISFESEDAEVGGFLDDVDGIATNHRFRLALVSNYSEEGTVEGLDADEGSPDRSALVFSFDVETADGREQAISLTAGGRHVPHRKGTTLAPREGSNTKGYVKNTNFGYYFDSLKNAGFPEPSEWAEHGGTPGNFTILDGINVHFLRVPKPGAKKASAKVANKEQAEGKRSFGSDTVLTVSEINALPWEKGGKKKKVASKKAKSADEDEDTDDDEDEEEEEEAPVKKASSKPAKKKPADDEEDEDEEDDDDSAEDDDEEEEADEDESEDEDMTAVVAAHVKAVLKMPEYKKGVSRDDLLQAVFSRVKKDKNKKAILEALQDDDVLNEIDGIEVGKTKITKA